MTGTTSNKNALQAIRSRQIGLARSCSDLILFHQENLDHEAGDQPCCEYCRTFKNMQREFASNTAKIQQIIILKKEEELQL